METEENQVINPAGTNSFQSFITAVNAVSGYGLLTMPYTLARGGWLSLVTLLIIAAICLYTALLLQRCLDSNSLVETYPDIGKLAFGSKGKTIMTILMNVELYLVVIGLLIIEGDNINRIFPGVEFSIHGLHLKGKQCFILFSTLLIIPTTWPRNLRVLSYLSLGSILVSLILIALVVWVGAVGVGFHKRGEFVNWDQMPTALSIFIFSYGGHTLMPTIYASMNDRTKFSNALIIGFAVSTILYGLMAVIGYLMFGEQYEPIVTLNLPSDKLASKFAIWIVIIMPFTKYALVIMPLNNSVEEQFHITKKYQSIILRSSLVMSTAIFAITVPYFSHFIAFTGSIITSMASIILPCICYMKIFKTSRMWGVEMPMIVCIIGVGVIIAISGTYVSTKNII